MLSNVGLLHNSRELALKLPSEFRDSPVSLIHIYTLKLLIIESYVLQSLPVLNAQENPKHAMRSLRNMEFFVIVTCISNRRYM